MLRNAFVSISFSVGLSLMALAAMDYADYAGFLVSLLWK